MSPFTVLHRSKSTDHQPLATMEQGYEVWVTCLREIAFPSEELSQKDMDDVKGLEIHQEEEALVFLLEVLCGLKSPVLGETEILAQFKSYLAQIGPEHPLRRESSLIPFLQNTSKEARTKFLKVTGSLSYGQVVRRWVKDADDVVMWGFGSLGSEIWPWVREKTKSVVVRQVRAADEEVPFVVGQSPEAEVHIVAAPLSDDKVRALAQRSRVIDLRDKSLQHPQVRTLQDLFQELSGMRKQREDIVPLCQTYLREKAQAYLARHQIRPFGWEDLCG